VNHPLLPGVPVTVAVTTGGVGSETVTVKVALPKFPAMSATPHCTVVEPSGNVDPEEGLQPAIGITPLVASVAVAGLNVTTAPPRLVAGAAMLAGGVITGGVVSRLIVTDDELDVPTPFVTEHVSVVPLVSALTVEGEQPVAEAIPDWRSSNTHDTVTSLTYHPKAPGTPLTIA